jgi:hypothetical protein
MTTPWVVVVSVLCAYSLLLGGLVLGLLRRIVLVLDRAEARLREPLHVQPPGLAIGSTLPPFQGYDVEGNPFDQTELFGQPCLVVFLSPDCQPCRALAAELQAIEQGMPAIFAVISDSPEGRAFAGRLSVAIIYQADHEISYAFGTNATPHVFAIDERGVVVGAGTANDVRGLRDISANLLQREVIDTGRSTI